MFNTIRARITAAAAFMLIVLIGALAVLNFFYYENLREIVLNDFSKEVSVSARNINKDVIGIEDNALDLAVFGEVYYKMHHDKKMLQEYTVKMFRNYTEPAGGGIWFEPYVIDKNKKRSCIYVYRNENNDVIPDSSYEGEEYNYLNQNWYKEIKSQLTKEKNIAWSKPYFEKEGSSSFMVTAGSGIYDGDKLIGISTSDWSISSVLQSVSKIKPSPNSFVLFADTKNDYIIISTDKYLNNAELIGRPLKNIPWYNDNLINVTYFTYHNTVYIPYVKYLDNGLVLIVNIPKLEMFRYTFLNFAGIFAILLLFSLCLISFIYFGLKRSIINPVQKLMELAEKMGNGDLNAHIIIQKPLEFVRLASAFDKMASDIKDTAKKKAMLDSELLTAKSIQLSSLPDKFPPFPERKEFNIYASMTPAKEVGGDFYDFYFLDENRFMFLAADVSGKGIPAALFMMRVKTLISNTAAMKLTPKEMIEAVNKKVCENNKEGFFVTLFACIIDLNTGKMSCINCGHTMPAVKQKNGIYEYLQIKSNIVLGAFNDAEFEIFETMLEPGGRIFLYTDGITEAANKKEEMYGSRRLLNRLNSCGDKDITETAEYIKEDVNQFASGAQQSDDITMLIFEYTGSSRHFKSTAVKENYKEFYSWLHNVCREWNLSGNLTNQIDMCGEEIFANIVFYAYPDKTGSIEAYINKLDNKIELIFMDEGISYNPLERENPDITLPPEKRTPGGLGIFMVKQTAESVTYKRADGKNILTLRFLI